MNEQHNLNLARKWRSKNFDTIVGQDLSIRMLKNSLYLNQYFPVYLFSGQRGCGKTTTARVFAAAINCEGLSLFQKQPKQSTIPCQACASCISMLAGKHPDFIEIDAASHTGVDNVRSIIEASSLLPLMGRKKVYLIDEAHMLSKAAFNAFLKILEEPPASVLFILATTDAQKIIETVKSRCFQIFFNPINTQELVEYLIAICDAESIPYDQDGLSIIVKESEGSARDALNILEQVRFSAPLVSKQNVLQVLGKLSDEHMYTLVDAAFNKQPHEIMALLADIGFERYNAEYMYQGLIETVRSLLWIKHGVARSADNELQRIASTISASSLTYALDVLCQHEVAFARTTKKHLLLEVLLLKFSAPAKVSSTPGLPPIEKKKSIKPEPSIETQQVEVQPTSEQKKVEHKNDNNQWNGFIEDIKSLNDPLLQSIFTQGIFESYDMQTYKVIVSFSNQLIFFKDWLEDTRNLWTPLLKKNFADTAQLESIFREGINVAPVAVTPEVKPRLVISEKTQPVEKKKIFFERASISKMKPKDKVVDVSDVQQWKTAHMILKYFPGTVVEHGG